MQTTVLLAETEEDLSILLSTLGDWCDKNKMSVNPDKSKVVHFRGPSVTRTDKTFMCGNTAIDVTDSYNYLGLLFTEHLNFNLMAKAAAKSASRALGLLISKFKALGGMPFNVYSTLYDNMVWPVLEYGAAIWGTTQHSCINAVHHRAIRFFLGVGRYTPSPAVNGEVGWTPPTIRQWSCVARHWTRLVNSNIHRLNRKIFIWTDQVATEKHKKNWNYRIHTHFKQHDLNHLLDTTAPLEKDYLLLC